MSRRLASLARTFRNEFRVYRSVVADPRCPRSARWLLGAAVAYAVSPVDLIPDFIPAVGHLDDFLILPLLVWLALRLIPEQLVLEHRMKYERDGGATDGMVVRADDQADARN